MTAQLVILAAKLRMLAHGAAAARTESKLKLALLAAAVAGLWIGAFALTRAALRWLDGLGGVLLPAPAMPLSELLLPRVLSLFSLVMLVMLVFSSVLVALATLYRAREMTFLVTTPLSWRTLFYLRFAEIVLFSSWSSAYLSSPMLLAYGLGRGAPICFYLAAGALFVPFVVIPAAAGAIAAMLLARVVPRLPRAALIGAAGVLALAAFAFFRARLGVPEFRDALDLHLLLRLTAEADNPFLPSAWFTSGLLAAARGATGAALSSFLLLLANALLLAWLAGELAERLFHSGWSALAGGRRRESPAHRRAPFGVLQRLTALLPAPARWLTLKDLTEFRRDPAQWSQLVIFFGVLALYLANMRTTAQGFSTSFWQGSITLLNTIACLLVVATLTTRFVFPLISLEGRRFWLLTAAPLPLAAILRQKFWLSVSLTTLVTVGLAVLSSWRLALPAVPFVVAVLTVVAASFGLSGLAVGLGGVYANFTEDNPARIVSGVGGTLTFIFSLAYVLLLAIAEAAVLHWGALARRLGSALAPEWAAVLALAFIAALTAFAALLPLRLGLRRLQHMEL
ncbi:MAG: hypothetical protein V1750_02130 [Acidobacteriota bacterium]